MAQSLTGQVGPVIKLKISRFLSFLKLLIVFFLVFDYTIMRIYKRKTERAKAPEGVVKMAIEAVITGKMSIKNAVTEFCVPRRTLSRYCTKLKRNQQKESALVVSDVADVKIGYKKIRQVS